LVLTTGSRFLVSGFIFLPPMTGAFGLLRPSYVHNQLAGTISRKTSDSTDESNSQNPLDIVIANALELLRGQNFEN
jgi:hypothetical protein